MLLLGSLLLPAAGILAAPRRAPAAAEVWCGQLDYGSFAKGAPINISFDASGATATVVLIYDVDAGHNKCSPDHEPGLKVTRNATYMTLAGTGANPDFYSFEGAIDGDNVTGWITSAGQKVGTFTAVKNGPPVVNGCNRCIINECEHWRGELDYPGVSQSAPLNVTISGDTATVDMIFDKNAAGTMCFHDTEPGLTVTRNATHITLGGTGKDPTFYSFGADRQNCELSVPYNIGTTARFLDWEWLLNDSLCATEASIAGDNMTGEITQASSGHRESKQGAT